LKTVEAKQLLLGALAYYKIDVLHVDNQFISIIKDYRIEIEQNGIYKLIENGQVIAPFADIDELCQFILL
jgi:hypothetical protein